MIQSSISTRWQIGPEEAVNLKTEEWSKLGVTTVGAQIRIRGRCQDFVNRLAGEKRCPCVIKFNI